MIPRDNHIMLYSMMQNLHTILTENKISYFIDGSTVLGLVRHKSIIPWNDYISIGILSDDFQLLINAKPVKQILDKGYSIESWCTSTYNLLKIFIPDKWQTDDEKAVVGTPTIDIYEYINHKDSKKIVLSNMEFRIKWTNSFYTSEELFPLQKYKLGPIDIFGPNDCKSYCDRVYTEWQTKYVIDKRVPLKGRVNNKVAIVASSDIIKFTSLEPITTDEISKYTSTSSGIFIDKTGFIIQIKRESDATTKSAEVDK